MFNMRVARWKLTIFIILALHSGWAQIKVVAPNSLVDDIKKEIPSAVIPGSTSTFGAPSKGDDFEGRLWYVDDSSGAEYCSKDYIATIKDAQANTPDPQNIGLRNILIVRRGRCPFAKKVYIAETFGNFDCVIIVDNSTSSWTREELSRVIIAADEGFATKVSIPSMLVTFQDGHRLIDAVNRNETVLVKIEWAIPQKHFVRVDLWTYSGSTAGNKFLKTYAPYGKMLKDHVAFTPHYHVFSLPLNQTTDLCIPESPMFCSEPPDGTSGITGREVLNENLRQLCIWSTYARHESNEKATLTSDEWWNYVAAFAERCKISGPTAQGPATAENKPDRLGDVCSLQIMNDVGINATRVAACVKDNWRQILKKEVANSAWRIVALRINGVRFNGELEPYSVSKSICSSFERQPAVCGDILSASQDVPIPHIETGKPVRRWFWFFLLCLCGLFSCYYIHQKRLKEAMQKSLHQEVMLEVKTQLQEYHRMSDNFGDPLAYRESRTLIQ